MASNENCVIRMGGLGDLAILSSSLLALKQKEPHRNLVLGTRLENMELLAGADYLSRVIFFEDADKEEWFRIYDCRWGVEPPNIGPGRTSWENYTQRDRSDIFDDLLGIRNGHKRFSIPVDSVSLERVENILKEANPLQSHLIGLSPTSKSPVRCMPPEYVQPLAEQLVKEWGPVVLFGKTPGWCEHLREIKGRWIINLIDRLNIKEVVALVSLMEVVISPDTGIYHVAAALEKKTLVLFGNIHPKTRITYYPTVKALYPTNFYTPKELSGQLLPCNPFPCWDVPFACSGIEPGQFGAHCMRLLTPGRIMAALKELI